MKTAEQWANRIQNSKEPWAKLVAEIQADALKDAAVACLPISVKCAGIINDMRTALTPNAGADAPATDDKRTL